MGYYIETSGEKGKVEEIIKLYSGVLHAWSPPYFSLVPPDQALICVVDNGDFEAAAFCYDEEEFKEFIRSDDVRHKEWLTITWDKAVELTGFPGTNKIREENSLKKIPNFEEDYARRWKLHK